MPSAIVTAEGVRTNFFPGRLRRGVFTWSMRLDALPT